MGSPYQMTNIDLGFINSPGQDFNFYCAFLNPVAITTNWSDLNLDSQGNWQAPPNFDTCAQKAAPYTPIANLGPNRIGFVGEPLYFDGTRSSQRYDTPVVSYSWSVTGSPTQTSYHNGSQLALTWNSPGLYTVSLTVKSMYGGASYTGTRQVMIYHDRSSAMNGVISLAGLSGSIANGGWQCEITTTSGQITLLPPDSVPPGTYYPFVVMAETRYEVVPDHWINATVGPYGNFNPGTPYLDARILFDGYVQNGTMHQDADKDTLSFSCQGPQLILQEAKTHQLGYYNATVKTYAGRSPGSAPTSLNTSAAGKGYLVDSLMTSDVIQSILQTHSNIAKFHDIHIWNSNIITQIYQPGGQQAYWRIVYTTLSVNEGTIWQNVSDLVTNEWAQAYFERDGSLHIGPSVNYQGADYWQLPTLLGTTVAASLINLVEHLGYTVGNDITQMANNIPTLPSMPMPVYMVHPWGSHELPQYVVPFQGPQKWVGHPPWHQLLNGPPVLCEFSDVPIFDNDDTAFTLLKPWLNPLVANTWPQDLSIYPISYDFPENYTGRAALVKLIGTCYGHSTTMTAWYPQNTFSVAGDGTSTIVTTTMPAGDWIVNESHLIGDVTTAHNKTLMINFFWEMARREYFAHNINYTGTITMGMATFTNLNDLVSVTRQNNVTGPHWSSKPFYINEIVYSIDLSTRSWTTTLSVTEVTSILLTGGPIKPPSRIPKF